MLVTGLGLVSGLSGLATEEALSVAGLIKNDTEACSIVNGFFHAVVMQIVPRISTPVAVAILKCKIFFRHRGVMLLVIVGFYNLS